MNGPVLVRGTATGVIPLVFWLLSRWIAGLLRLSTWPSVAFQAVFTLLGAGLAAVFYVYSSRRSRAAKRTAPNTEDLASLWSEVRSRIAGSNRIAADTLGRLPLLVVVGPSGGAKTTTVLQSGLEPELLAGATMEQDGVVPTRGFNAWFGSGWAILEAAQDVFADRVRWEWLAENLRADRLRAALAGARQAPRAVLLCYPCPRLTELGAELRTEAQELRARLLTLAAALGVNIPVYVLFTKLDRVSFFTDYTRRFGADDAERILGATLARAGRAAQDAFAQAEAAQVSASFDEIVAGLSHRRTDLLEREASEEVRLGAYEFPREFSKLKNGVKELLVELGRPSQLGVGPLIRGFYFTGVRPVAVDDQPGFVSLAPSSATGVEGATMVFSRQQAMASPPAGGSAGRRVPQWVFLPRLIRDVVFSDRAALAVTESGTRVSGLRRAVLSLVTLAAVSVSILFAISYASNRALQNAVAHAVANVGEGPAQETLEVLSHLDTLGTLFSRLRLYQQEGVPVRLRWGLYQGDRLIDPSRAAYFARFDQQLGGATRDALTTTLRSQVRGADPGDRATAYAAFKAYLMTHALPARASESFLPATLMLYWSGGQTLDPESEPLAKQAFAFYARELSTGDIAPADADDALIRDTRAFLKQASADDRVYQAITGAVTAEDVRFAGRFATQLAISNPYVVPGAFSRAGWNEVQAKLSGDLISDEDWVIGEAPLPPENIAELRSLLADRYLREYVDEWQSFVEAGSVRPFGTVGDAYRALEVVGDPDSPLIGMLAIVADQTDVDSTVSTSFSAVHHLAAPNTGAPTPDAQPYLQALQGLSSSLATVDQAEGPSRQNALIVAQTDARRAADAVADLALGMGSAAEGERVRRAVRRLLEGPVERARGVLGALPASELNGKGRELCRQLDRVLTAYPFNRGAANDADPEDVATELGRGSSTLWNFYDESLAGIIAEVQARFRRASGASPSPTDDFVRFFDRAARVSRGLFPGEAGDVEVTASLAMVPPPGVESITVEINGSRNTFTQTSRGSWTFTWVPDASSRIRITASTGRASVPILEATGTWALMRAFEGARWANQGNGVFSVTWSDTGLSEPLTGRISFGNDGIEILDGQLIGSLQCVPTVAR